MEALKKWDGGCALRGEGSGEVALPSQLWGSGKFLENIGAKLCNLVQFWRPVQQKIYNSVFRFCEINLMTLVHLKWHGKSTLTVSAI